MIQLYQYAPAFGLPNASPFCMKLETYLRMAQIPYESPRFSLKDMQRAPKGKLPYIRDGQRSVADSSLIIDHLKATHGDPLDSWMSPVERATALAWQRLMEEHLYWSLLHSRWIEDDGWTVTRPAFFGALPTMLQWIIPPMARRAMVRELHGHGMGRHSVQEIRDLGCKDISALSAFLGDKPFFMGEQPTSLDAVAYAFVANILWAPLQSTLSKHAQTLPNLEAYCVRMRDRYYAA